MPPSSSPRVSQISWGRVTTPSQGSFKDAQLYPGGAREWDWRETGTRHSPGIQPDDLRAVLSHGAEVVVLGTGMHGRLQVPADTVEFLHNQGVKVFQAKTREAVRRYNELVDAEVPVGALIHSTC